MFWEGSTWLSSVITTYINFYYALLLGSHTYNNQALTYLHKYTVGSCFHTLPLVE